MNEKKSLKRRKKTSKESFWMKSYKNTINEELLPIKLKLLPSFIFGVVYKLERIKTFLHWLTERTNIEWTSRLHLRLLNKKKDFSPVVFFFWNLTYIRILIGIFYVESTHIEHGTARKKRKKEYTERHTFEIYKRGREIPPATLLKFFM